ncbi:unnamed protein product [Arctogadus glacialis]
MRSHQGEGKHNKYQKRNYCDYILLGRCAVNGDIHSVIHSGWWTSQLKSRGGFQSICLRACSICRRVEPARPPSPSLRRMTVERLDAGLHQDASRCHLL